MNKYVLCFCLFLSNIAVAQETMDDIKITAQLHCIEYTDINCWTYLKNLREVGIKYRESSFLTIAGMIKRQNEDYTGALEAYRIALSMLDRGNHYNTILREVKSLQKLAFAQRVENKGRRLVRKFDKWLDE